jgi:hypothetical protein
MSTILNPRAVRALSMALLALLLAGVAAQCDEGGMYQGGSDSSPRYR